MPKNEAYDKVCNILWSDCNWPRGCAPAPIATGAELEKRDPESVAKTFDSYIWGIVDESSIPPDFVNIDAWYRQLCHQAFAIGKEYWEYSTQLALGQIVEKPVDKIPEAKSVSEWMRNQSLGRNRLGLPLLDETPQAEEEMKRRVAKAEDIPIEWLIAGKALHWRLAVIEGMLPVTLDGFSAVYAAKNPSFAEIRNWDAQKWLDNLRAAHRQGSVRQKWLEDGTLNPSWNKDWD